MNNRVVITGIGWVTPLGWDIETVWARLLAGTSAVAPITHFDASTFPTTFAAEVSGDYDHLAFVAHRDVHENVGLNTAFALGAAAQAWRWAGLDRHALADPARLGIYLGSGEGSLDFQNYVTANLAGWDADRRAVDGAKWAAAARERFTALGEIEQEPNMALSHLAMEFDAQGPAYNCLTACAASTQALGEASCIIRRGDADIMISGGAHTMIHPFGVTGFNRLTALSTDNDDPKRASRPFSADRGGFVLGEGAGMLVLESLDHAQQRGATPLAEIVGYGSSADAYRITDIEPDGRGAVVAMREALHDAQLEPGAIDYISAHGTGTKENDSTETRAVRTVFGDRAASIPMSSVKSMLGHLIAAAGAVELITCVLALRDGKVPPTINLDNPDPAFADMDHVPHHGRDADVRVCLSNSFGFGGQNDTLIVRSL
ncbi:MAG: beta-ketoacyl-[acyl-carrier-protein] synthase family protein [Phycisphaeraceae bacterium]